MGTIEFTVTEAENGLRLDRYLASNVLNISRSTIQRLIRNGQVTVGTSVITQPSHRTRPSQVISCKLPEEKSLVPGALELDILYEDDSIVVVNKQPGLVVHPGAGQNKTTLVEGLLVDRDLPIDDDPSRPGIVHRLDKDTSGTMVVAKTPSAMHILKEQFAARAVRKLYIAQVEGIVNEEEGMIDAPIGRNPTNPRCMAINSQGRSAQTEFRVLQRRDDSSLLMVHLRTGRTHQIRIHMRYIGHTVIGDVLYGHAHKRLMLHAWRLGFTHPQSGERMSFTAPIPPEFDVPEGVSLDDMANDLHF